MEDKRCRHLHHGRDQVIGERAGEEAAVRPVGLLLQEGGSQGLGEAARDLPRDHARMEDAAAVVHADVTLDPDLGAHAIDLERADIEDEAVTEGAIDLVGLVGCSEPGRRPEHGLADRLVD